MKRKRSCLDCGVPIAAGSARCRECSCRRVGQANKKDWGRCIACGERRSREGKYCSRACYDAHFRQPTGSASPHWRGDSVSEWAARNRTRKAIPPGPCEICGAEDAHRHHVDRNIHNNDPTNIRYLCSHHHKKLHGAEDPQLGSRNGQAKLDEAVVAEIKRALAAGEKGVHLAAKYQVRDTTISHIKRGKTWRHVQA